MRSRSMPGGRFGPARRDTFWSGKRLEKLWMRFARSWTGNVTSVGWSRGRWLQNRSTARSRAALIECANYLSANWRYWSWSAKGTWSARSPRSFI